MIKPKKEDDKNKNDNKNYKNYKNNENIVRKDKDQEHTITTLKVAEAYHKDVGRGIARIDPVACKELDLLTGDAIELSVSLPQGGNNDNKARAVVLNWPAYEEDYGKGLIRVDGYTRSKLGIGINDTVEIKKIESKDAISITLAPTEPLRIVGAEQYLSDLLQGTIVSKGDIIPLGIMGQQIDLVVISTNPSNIPVTITESTQITISEEVATARREKQGSGAGRLSVSYEDVGGLRDEVNKVREMIESSPKASGAI